MEINHKHIAPDIDVYWTSIGSSADRRRLQEQAAERLLLSRIFNKEVCLRHYPNGEPYIDEVKFITISHSKNYIVIAISPGTHIGIDIEEMHPRLEQVKHKFLTEQELQIIDSIEDLAICWSSKEAIYKIANQTAGALGENIRLSVNDIKQHKQVFSASIANDEYTLQLISQQSDYEIILAYARI